MRKHFALLLLVVASGLYTGTGLAMTGTASLLHDGPAPPSRNRSLWHDETARSDSVASQTDSSSVDTSAAVVRTWVLAEDYTLRKDFRLDTVKTGFQVYNPVYRNSICSSWLGNIGQPVKNNILYADQPDPGFLFLRPFAPYIFTHGNTVYYNVRKPYTLLGYDAAITSGPKKEETFSAIHTQNINPYFNFGARIRLSDAEGQYLRQALHRSHFNAWTSYNKEDYSMHADIVRNSFKLDESGGILSDSLFRATRDDERTYDVKLEDANSEIRNTAIQLTQRYRFGKEQSVPDSTAMPDSTGMSGMKRLRARTAKSGSILHTISYSRSWRLYEDDFTGLVPGFYGNFYLDSLQSHDSTGYRNFSNTIQLMLDENPNRKTDFGARAFARYELEKFTYASRYNDTTDLGKDTLRNNTHHDQFNNISVGASLVHTVGTGWNWIFRGETFLAGYRIGDVMLNGEITKFIGPLRKRSHIRLAGRFSLTEPDYFYNHYASNHFRWQHDFAKVKELLATLEYENPAAALRARAWYSVLTDYVYMETDTMPAQFGGGLLLVGGVASKELGIGPFHSVHKLAWQFSSNRFIVRIPDLAYYTSNFVGFTLVRDVLTMQFGFDLYYNTLFSGYAYMPATGMFYNQDVRQVGNYPYLDVFLTARLKRARAFIKVEHPYAQAIEKNYFHVLDYPMPGMNLKFGLAWSFYD